MSTTLQLLGAGLVLIAFVGAQRGALHPRSCPSLVLNLVGAGTLAVLAWLGADWGFFALEAIWAVVAAAGLLARLRGSGSADAPIGTSAEEAARAPRVT